MEQLIELADIPPATPRAPDSTPPVLVLNMGQMTLHHGSVGIIRSLGKMNVPVYAVVEDRFTPAAVSKYLTGAFIWNTRHLNADQLLKGMSLIGECFDRPAIVIPTGDVGAIFVAEHAATLRRWFLFPEQPATLPRTLSNKTELYQLCNRLGVPCPLTVFPDSIDDVNEFLKHAAFPVVVKAAESWLLPEGARTTTIARTREQVHALYRSAESQGTPNLILQEYIDPVAGEDWFYHGYRNSLTDCQVGFTGRKLRSYPAFAGPTTLGKSLENKPLRQQAEAFLAAISYSGIMDIDFRLDKRDGKYKLLDFNPRIGAQFRLLEDRAGMNVAQALYLDLAGRHVARSPAVVGRTFIVEFHDLVASLGYFRKGRLTFGEWRRSLKGAWELAWFSRDDLFPFVMMCIRLLFRVVGRVLRVKPSSTVPHCLPRYARGRLKASQDRPCEGVGVPVTLNVPSESRV